MRDRFSERRGRLISLALLLTLSFAFPIRVFGQAAPGTPIKQTAIITGTVTDSNGHPIAGANVQLSGPSNGQVTTDYQGAFTFAGVSFGEYSIVVTTKQFGAVARYHIAVNTDVSIAVQYAAAQVNGLKTIAQVSTNGRATINVTPASITAINPSAYAFEGQTSWHQILEQIPGVGVGGALLAGDNPSLYVPESPFFPAQLTINGAEPYETATLMDGMPLNLSTGFSEAGAGNDVSVLPLNGFDSADIIRGPGADSPSIVDSVGGSFVFHIPGPVYQNRLDYSLSTDAYGGINSNLKYQFHTGRFSVTMVYGVNDSPGPINGTQIAARGSLLTPTINGNPNYCPGGFFEECIGYLGNKYAFFGSPPEFDHFLVPFLMCCVNVSSAWSAHTGSIGAAYQIGPQVTAQVFYGGTTEHAYQFAPYWLTTFEPGSLGTSGGGAYTGSIPAGNYYYMGAEYNNLADDSTSVLEEKVTANFGASVLRVSALQTYSDYLQDLAPNYTPGYYKLYGTTCYESGSGCVPVTFNGTPEYLIYPYPSYIDNVWSNGRDIAASYSTQLGSNMNAGVSYVTAYYNYPYWAVEGNLYHASEPPSISETGNEARLHFGIQPVERLNLDLSWYFSGNDFHIPNPSDPLNALNPEAPRSWVDNIMNYNAPRFGAVYRAGNDVAIRAAAGGGFSIPPIAYLIGSNGIPTCSGGFCSQTLTNVNLQPEKSFGLDVGTDVRIHGTTSLSFDLYRTNLWGQLFEAIRNGGFFESQPLSIVEYQNFNESIMEGINFELHHDIPRGLYWDLGVGLTRGYIPSLPASFYLLPGCTTPCTNTTLVPGINYTGGNSPGRIPYSNGNATIGYRWAPKKYIEVTSAYIGPNNSYFVKPFVALDLRGGYAITPNIALLATFENVTCEDCGLYAINSPSTVMGIPSVSGTLPWEGLPAVYSPRSLLLTLNYSY